MKETLNKLQENKWIYALAVTLVVLAFLIQAVIYAHQMPSRVDEGSFLIKGYYYVKGTYQPFQDYGPWTNNMPLSYYIPGLAQVLFGPGLQTGRYFAIFVALLMLLGMGLLVNRLRGKWWALAALLLIALNPALIKIYVQAVSQVIVACLVTWALYFLIDEKRSLLQIGLGAFFCALATLTRQNMIFMMLFVVLYAYFIFGRKAGRVALLSAGVPFLLMHVIFFPKILNLWAVWLPGFVRDLFNYRVISGGGEQVWSPEIGLLTRFTSFFTAVRYYFIPLIGMLLCLLTLPRKDAWRSKYERKTVLYLSILFIIMFLMHAWASLGKDYCVYCFPNYLAFFIPVAVLLAVIALSNLAELQPKVNGWWALLLVLIFLPGAFLGSLETVGRWVMGLAVPRVKGGQILSGSTELWKLFENRFGFTYDQILPYLSVAFGLAVTIIFLLLVWGLYRWMGKRKFNHIGNFILTSLIVVSFVLMPSPLLGNMVTENTCGGDVLAAYETVGAQLDELIPVGATVYWAGGSEVTPLLYLTDVYFQPQLLNGVYSKRVGGDRAELEKNGYYNQESVEVWRAEADFVINGNTKMVGGWLTFLNADDFDEYRHTDALDPCDPATYLRIYKAKK
jgi:4-amino-4-deoxy-L-arabinose transferase-like glycosyltransferase